MLLPELSRTLFKLRSYFIHEKLIIFFIFFFGPFTPISQIKLGRVHHQQETLEGVVCWVEQSLRACVSRCHPCRWHWLTGWVAGAEVSHLPSAVTYLVGQLCCWSQRAPGMWLRDYWGQWVISLSFHGFWCSSLRDASRVKGPGCWWKLLWICKPCSQYAVRVLLVQYCLLWSVKSLPQISHPEVWFS